MHAGNARGRVFRGGKRNERDTVPPMRSLLFVVALALAVSGCSEDRQPPSNADDSPSLTPTASTDPTEGTESPSAADPSPTGVPPREVKAARRTFNTWFGAFVAGNGDRACPLQTPHFTQQQIKRLAERDRIERGASCGDLVQIVGILFEALRLEVGEAEVTRAPSDVDEVAFAVVFKGFASLGYSLIDTKNGWRVDQDLTSN
jgi:hypothetical protein